MLPLSTKAALQGARDTRCLEIGQGALAAVPRVFRGEFGDRPGVVVADRNTYTAAGRATGEALVAAGVSVEPPFVFEDPQLYAEQSYLELLESELRRHTAIPIACGSGTINDLTKLAAHRADRPYMCVATAASMDGYTAFGASITQHGSKQTFFCPAPRAVVADLDIIAAAPGSMSSWGYADLLAKVTAGADWILADALGEEPIHQQAWNLVQNRLRELLANPAQVGAGETEAIGRLVEGLMLGGFAMQSAQSSRPASGAEHQFSHLWDMQQHKHHGQTPSHGFKVGLGTLAISALYEELLRCPIEKLDIKKSADAWPELDAWLAQSQALLGEGELGKVAFQEIRAKYRDKTQIAAQLEQLRKSWPELRARLEQQLLPFAEVREKLLGAGAPVEPEQIGISRDRLRASYWQAYFLRRRFTVLDLTARAGLLDRSLDRIFGADGIWRYRAGR